MPINSKMKRRAYGILNPLGEPWTSKAFDCEEEARDYIENFWAKVSSPPDLTRFQIVPVTIIF